MRPGDSVAIVISDITRPVPNHILLPPILETLAGVGVPRERVVIVNGTGMHRANTRDELHRCWARRSSTTTASSTTTPATASTLAFLRRTGSGAEIWVNRDYLEADVKILTGFVEPHIFAGYSGGGKAVLPGIAGAETILSNHGDADLADPKATWCVTEGNPVFEEIAEVALATRPTLPAST